MLYRITLHYITLRYIISYCIILCHIKCTVYHIISYLFGLADLLRGLPCGWPGRSARRAHSCLGGYYVYIYIYRERERCVYIYIYIYIHTYIHTYMHTCMHTYIHTYIHHSQRAPLILLSLLSCSSLLLLSLLLLLLFPRFDDESAKM